MMKRKKIPICITGGSGFIGRHLCRALLASHTGEIVVIDRNPLPAAIGNQILFRRGDAFDPALLDEGLKRGGIWIHLAGTSNQAEAEKDPINVARTNLQALLPLLRLAGEKRIAKIIFPSSAPAVYGIQKKLPVSTSAEPHPISSYGAVKLSIEFYIQYFARLGSFDFVILRGTNIYGPGQLSPTHGVISRFIHNILRGKTIEIWGSPKTFRDFVFIDDFVRAIQKAAQAGVKNTVLNIGSGRKTTLLSLIRTIEEVTDKKAVIEIKKGRTIDIPSIYLDVRPTKQILHWEPKISLMEGIRRTVAWMKSAEIHGKP